MSVSLGHWEQSFPPRDHCRSAKYHPRWKDHHRERGNHPWRPEENRSGSCRCHFSRAVLSHRRGMRDEVRFAHNGPLNCAHIRNVKAAVQDIPRKLQLLSYEDWRPCSHRRKHHRRSCDNREPCGNREELHHCTFAVLSLNRNPGWLHPPTILISSTGGLMSSPP